MALSRRGFFGAAAATPFARLEDIPCHKEPDFPDRGQITLVQLFATRERDRPTIDIEVWKSDLEFCSICEAGLIQNFKVRETFEFGSCRLTVPPVTEPTCIIVPISTTCQMWIQGEKVDWLAFEDIEHPELLIKRGYFS